MKKRLVKPFELTKNFLNLVNVKKVKCSERITTCSFRYPEDNSFCFIQECYDNHYKEHIEIQKNAEICMCSTECCDCFYNQRNILNVFKLRKKIMFK